MIPAHRVETRLTEDNKLSLDHLPFLAGQTVEVIVIPVSGSTPVTDLLQGSVLHYDRPTEPVAETEWDAAK